MWTIAINDTGRLSVCLSHGFTQLCRANSAERTEAYLEVEAFISLYMYWIWVPIFLTHSMQPSPNYFGHFPLLTVLISKRAAVAGHTHRQAYCGRRCRQWRTDAAASRYDVCLGTCWRRSEYRWEGDGKGWWRHRTAPSRSAMFRYYDSFLETLHALVFRRYSLA